MTWTWQAVQSMTSRSYTCGYCGFPLSSEKGWVALSDSHPRPPICFIYVCHHCGKPTFFDSTKAQTPGTVAGVEIAGIEDKAVQQLYNEARRAVGSGLNTSAVLGCRKLLMHIAVANGADEGLKFIQYVEYLSDKNFIPPGSKGWVDHIRDKGNEANHEIAVMSPQDAEDLLAFIGMLLKIIYEFPARVKSKSPKTS
jgi:hypothetical protein